MSNQSQENLAKVRELMNQQAQQINAGNTLEHGVPIDYTTAFGTHIQGTVVFKRPGMMDYMKMGGLKSEALRQGGVVDINLVDNTIKFMAHVISTLKVVVVKCPEWLLKIDEVKEPDILYHVYAKYEEWEESFRQTSKPASAEGNSEPTEPTQDMATS